MFVKQVLNQVFKDNTDASEAIKILALGMSREQLAEFIVTSFKRGWIDRYAMGIPMSEVTLTESVSTPVSTLKV